MSWFTCPLSPTLTATDPCPANSLAMYNKQTDRDTNIAAYRLNRSGAQFSENVGMQICLTFDLHSKKAFISTFKNNLWFEL